MEIKQVVNFEIKKEDRTYRLEIPNGAPLGECYESCCTFMDKILQYINEHADKMRPKEPVSIEEGVGNEKKDE